MDFTKTSWKVSSQSGLNVVFLTPFLIVSELILRLSAWTAILSAMSRKAFQSGTSSHKV